MVTRRSFTRLRIGSAHHIDEDLGGFQSSFDLNSSRWRDIACGRRWRRKMRRKRHGTPRRLNRDPWKQHHGRITIYGARGMRRKWRRRRRARSLERQLPATAPITPGKQSRRLRLRRYLFRRSPRPALQFSILRRNRHLAGIASSIRLPWWIGPRMKSPRGSDPMNSVRKEDVPDRSRRKSGRRDWPRWTLRKRIASRREVMVWRPEKITVENASGLPAVFRDRS